MPKNRPLLLLLILTVATASTLMLVRAEKRTLQISVACFEFPDQPHSASIESVKYTAIETVKQFYEKVSYGQLTVTGEIYGWYMMTIPLSKFDVCRWGSPSQDRRGLVSSAFYTLNDKGIKLTGQYTFFVFSGQVWGFAFPWEKLSVQNERSNWGTYAHELGHSLGLPDLYSYAEAELGQSSSIYAGSWDIMSTSSADSMCAWSRIKLGWIRQNQIVTLAGNQQGAVTISSIELGQGTLVLRIFIGYSQQYYLAEARQDIGVLITYIDDTKEGGKGIVTVVDATPNSRSLHDAYLGLGLGKTSIYINDERNFALILLRKVDSGYEIYLTNRQEGLQARNAQQDMQAAQDSIQVARQEIRLNGLDQAITILQQSTQSYEEKRFTEAARQAENAKAIADKATIPAIYYETKQELETISQKLAEVTKKTFEAPNAVQKLNEATTTLQNATTLFQSLEFGSALTSLARCKELILEAEQVEQEYQDRKQLGIAAIVGTIILVSSLLILLARKRQAHRYQHNREDANDHREQVNYKSASYPIRQEQLVAVEETSYAG
jgi:hypothetical protein